MSASIQRPRALRRSLTDAEQFLWQHLRLRQIDGHKFRRQRPIGRYIVDFVCLEKKVVIELDGGQHSEEAGYDAKRDRWLQGQGYQVLRFWNHEVLKNMDQIREVIWNTLAQPPPSSSPETGEEKSG